ncbi:MAG: SCO family protein [Burkholderiaceae bacterium]|nr:SCO family protein [Burkholderiaceae bacterium]
MLRTAVASAAFALVALASAAWLTHDFRTWTQEAARRYEVAQAPVPAPAVQMLVPGVGRRALADLLAADGAVTLVDFVYTGCQSVCASLGSAFQQLQARIRAAEAGAAGAARAPVRLLSISFDPARDDVATLERYASALNARADTWRFATVADARRLEPLLRRFRVVVIPDGLGGFEHNAALLVVDQRGRLVRIFDYDRIDDALGFARAIAERGADGWRGADG